MATKPTPRELDTLNALFVFQRNQLRPPKLRELAEILHIRRARAGHLRHWLERKGLVVRPSTPGRPWQLTGRGISYLYGNAQREPVKER